jgi:hypothetical protein
MKAQHVIAMKPETVLKDFSALSFEAGQVTSETNLAIPDSLPRLTPESVRDFSVQHNGSANGDSAQNDRLPATRHCPAPKVGRCLLMPGTRTCRAAEREAPSNDSDQLALPLPKEAS